MLGTALALARRGMRVFPCQPRQKEPATQHGCKDATADPEVIRAWWRERLDCNVAIATGAGSGVFVVDVDGADAEVELRRLETEHGALPATVEVITPRGTAHLFSLAGNAGAQLHRQDCRRRRRARQRRLCAVAAKRSSVRQALFWSVDSAAAIAPAPDWLLARIGEPANGNGAAARHRPSGARS